MSAIVTQYVCKRGYQPVCQGVDASGELLWGQEMKKPWHLKMFPVHYGGDFFEQWMYKSLQEKGFEWTAEDQKEFNEDRWVLASKRSLWKLRRKS